ncbi:cilia- and flagella-associated protein 263-like isoform X2 [Tachypleus tridentatus]|uniref:cilia- and flagella-associated protein 263-like isoform X2 n=1 Tax=Tachypleus tridentatus TaxID=6853 RepID=UPI003FD28279
METLCLTMADLRSVSVESELATFSSSDAESDGKLMELSDEQIQVLTEDILSSVKFLAEENAMLENYIQREGLKDVMAPTPTVGYAHSGQISPITTFYSSQRSSVSTSPGTQSRILSTSDLHGHRRKSKTRGLGTDKKSCLTIQQKLDVMLQELDEIRESREKFQKTSESKLENLKAEIEESENRFTELKKAQANFERDITKGSFHSRTGNVMAEKVQRYFQDKIKAKDILREKLRMRYISLRGQYQRVLEQMKTKEEMGEELNEVDFSQLKIENSRYLHMIEKRNQQLVHLKLMTSDSLQVLNDHKDKALTEQRLQNFQKEMSDFQVPSVMEYIQQQSLTNRQETLVHIWRRKLSVAQMNLQQKKKSLKSKIETASKKDLKT